MSSSPPSRFAPRRQLGSTGFIASVLGAGDLADRSLPLSTCVATLQRALDAGLNVVDTAPSYEDGYSEQVVGEALYGRREGVFVIDKIDHIDQPVDFQIDQSLNRLGMAEVDLWVFHSISEIADWRQIVTPGGPMDQLDAAIKDGLGRFRGISSHNPAVLLEAIASERCDVVMFPVGPLCDDRYIEEVLPLCRARGVGTVCFKAFGAGKLVADTEGYGKPLSAGLKGLPKLSPEACVHYAMTCDPDVVLLGLSTPAEQDVAFAAAESFAPMSVGELRSLELQASEAAKGKGERWWDPPAEDGSDPLRFPVACCAALTDE